MSDMRFSHVMQPADGSKTWHLLTLALWWRGCIATKF